MNIHTLANDTTVECDDKFMNIMLLRYVVEVYDTIARWLFTCYGCPCNKSPSIWCLD